MSKILDNLYLGSYADAKNHNFLISLGITHVVTVGAELKAMFPKVFKYLYIPAYDSPEFRLSTHFDEIADFIHSAIKGQGKVFVHCYWGISRSTASVIAYLVKHHGMDPLEAKMFIKQKRPMISPNDGFVKQLEVFGKKVADSKVKRYKEEREFPKTLFGKPWPKKVEPQNNRATTSHMSARSSSMASSRPGTRGPELQQSSMGFGFKGIEPTVKSLEKKSSLTPSHRLSEVKKELEFVQDTKQKVNDGDFCCVDCGIRLFNLTDVAHNTGQNFSKCNAIYLNYMPWIGYMRKNLKKIFCPNPKCNTILGFANQRGGRCTCDKVITGMYLIYPVRVITPQLKTVNRPDSNNRGRAICW